MNSSWHVAVEPSQLRNLNPQVLAGRSDVLNPEDAGVTMYRGRKR